MGKLLVTDENKILYESSKNFLLSPSSNISDKKIVNLQNKDLYTVEPNVFYCFENIHNNFEIRFSTPFSGVVNEYNGKIYVKDTAVSVTFPTEVRWVTDGTATIDKNIVHLLTDRIYLYSVHNGIGLISSVLLDQLATCEISLDNKVLSWPSVENADYYNIYLDTFGYNALSGEIYPPTTFFTTITDPKLDLSQYALSSYLYGYAITVEADSYHHAKSARSEVARYRVTRQFDAPWALSLSDNGILSWQSNALSTLSTSNDSYYIGAESPEGIITVIAGDQLLSPITVTSLDLKDTTADCFSAAFKNLLPGVPYKIRVKAHISSGVLYSDCLIDSEYSSDYVIYTWEEI